MHRHEIWRAVVGFEGLYEVSDLGRVRSLDREEKVTRVRFGRVDSHTRVRRGCIVSTSVGTRGYRTTCLWKDGGPYYRGVHTLVLEAFVGRKPFQGCVGRHLDGDRLNNAPSNLAWGTQRDNVHDSIRHGTWVHGETSGLAKLTDEKVRKIRRSAKPQRALAREFGVSQGTVCMVKNNYSWKHVDA